MKRFRTSPDDNRIYLTSPRQQPYLFPRWYIIPYILTLAAMLVSFVGGGFLITYWIAILQKIVLVNNQNAILLSPNLQLICILPSMFICLYIFTVAINCIAHYLFPKLDEYAAYMQLKQQYGQGKISKATEESLLKTVDFEKLAEIEWKRNVITTKVFGVLLLIFTPVYLLSFDAYTKIDEKGLHHNAFFSLSEKTTSWSEISKASLDYIVKWDKEDKEYDFYPKLILSKPDNQEIIIWDSVGMGSPTQKELVPILDAIRKYRIPFTVTPLNSLAFSALEHYNMRKEVPEIFQYAESIMYDDPAIMLLSQ